MSTDHQGDSAVTEIIGEGLIIERDKRRLLDVNHVVLGEKACSVIVGPNGAGKSLLTAPGNLYWSKPCAV